jgi:hypothetical protein
MDALIELVVEVVACDVNLVASAVDPRARVVVEVEGVEVARGRGRAEWTGAAPPGASLVATARGERIEGVAPAQADYDVDLRVDLPRVPRAGVVPVGLAFVGPCPERFGWAVSVTPFDGTPAQRGTFAVGDATVSLDLVEGPYVVRASLVPVGGVEGDVWTRRDTPIWVGPPCVDRDGDGACRHGFRDDVADCDDDDPARVPGAPDVADDGVDSDCDGALAGDDDGDGHDGATDCDDADPTVHPGAVEWDDGVDSDCDGSTSDERPASFWVRSGAGFHLGADGQLVPVRVVDPDDAGRDEQGSFDLWAHTFAPSRAFRTPSGQDAWLVVGRYDVLSVAMSGEGATAFVLVAEGTRGLSLAGVLPLGEVVAGIPWGCEVGDCATSPGGRIDTPRVTADGIFVGPTRYAWRDGALGAAGR